jgi:hypothetical protein
MRYISDGAFPAHDRVNMAREGIALSSTARDLTGAALQCLPMTPVDQRPGFLLYGIFNFKWRSRSHEIQF